MSLKQPSCTAAQASASRRPAASRRPPFSGVACPSGSRRKPSAGTTGCGRQGQGAASGPRRRPGSVERSGSAGLRPLCQTSCGKCGRSRRAVCSVVCSPSQSPPDSFRGFPTRERNQGIRSGEQLWNGVFML